MLDQTTSYACLYLFARFLHQLKANMLFETICWSFSLFHLLYHTFSQVVLVARDGIYLHAPRTVGKCYVHWGGVCAYNDYSYKVDSIHLIYLQPRCISIPPFMTRNRLYTHSWWKQGRCARFLPSWIIFRCQNFIIFRNEAIAWGWSTDTDISIS